MLNQFPSRKTKENIINKGDCVFKLALFKGCPVSGYFWLLSTRIGESGIRIRNFLNPLSSAEIFEYAMTQESSGR